MKKTEDEPIEPGHIHLSAAQQGELETDSLGEKLSLISANLPSGGVTLAEMRDLVGQDGLLLLVIALTVVFMVPVSIPGVSTVFGAAILLIGICRLLDRTFWLPKRIEHRVLPSERIRAAINVGSQWLHRLERMSRPHRLNWMASAGLMEVVNSAALIIGALLLMAPFGLIPFSNTLPALALLFLAVGLLQRDGLCVLFGHLLNVVSALYFAVLALGGLAFLREVFHYLVGA
jgi:hypothetical protein